MASIAAIGDLEIDGNDTQAFCYNRRGCLECKWEKILHARQTKYKRSTLHYGGFVRTVTTFCPYRTSPKVG